MQDRYQDRSGAVSRPTRLPALAALLACLAPGTAWAADLLDSLYGRWATDTPAPFAMSWAKGRDGFELRWAVPGGKEATARFTPTGRPGVFAGQAGQGWSMFGGGEPVNPLVGGTLYWARSTPDAFYLYSLEIDDQGAFVLDRYACRSAGEGRLSVALQRRLPEGKTEEIDMQLAKAGP